MDWCSKIAKLLEINYNQHQRVKRLPAPSITTALDTHVSSIDVDFNFPYAVFTTTDNTFDVHDTEPMSIWAPEHKNIMVTSVGGTRIVVPKEAKEYFVDIDEGTYEYLNFELLDPNPKSSSLSLPTLLVSLVFK